MMTQPSAKKQEPPFPPKMAGLQKTLMQLFPVVNSLPATPPAPNLADNGPKAAKIPEPMTIDGEEKNAPEHCQLHPKPQTNNRKSRVQRWPHPT